MTPTLVFRSRNAFLRCEQCGVSIPLPPAMAIRAALERLEAFCREHEWCLQRARAQEKGA